jgi:hypothetical protein
MYSSTLASPSQHRTAALIDVENLLIHDADVMGHTDAARVLNEVRRLTSGMPTRTATGPLVLRTHTSALAAFGGGLTLVAPVKDGADQVLIEAAHDLAAQGVTDLVIASGDHAFAELASIARLHVISFDSHLSRRLRLAASTVQLLDHTAGRKTTTEWKVAG